MCDANALAHTASRRAAPACTPAAATPLTMLCPPHRPSALTTPSGNSTLSPHLTPAASFQLRLAGQSTAVALPLLSLVTHTSTASSCSGYLREGDRLVAARQQAAQSLAAATATAPAAHSRLHCTQAPLPNCDFSAASKSFTAIWPPHCEASFASAAYKQGRAGQDCRCQGRRPRHRRAASIGARRVSCSSPSAASAHRLTLASYFWAAASENAK